MKKGSPYGVVKILRDGFGSLLIGSHPKDCQAIWTGTDEPSHAFQRPHDAVRLLAGVATLLAPTGNALRGPKEMEGIVQ